MPGLTKEVLSRLFDDVITIKTTKKPTHLEAIWSGVQCYCHEMIAELSDNPLKWWIMQEVHYVHLIKVVKNICACLQQV